MSLIQEPQRKNAQSTISLKTHLELDQYLNFEEDCSGLFDSYEIEAAKLLMKSV
jgi:hypothetical protein